MSAAVLSALLLASQPQPVGGMDCGQIAAELTQVVRSTMSGAHEQVRLARAGEQTLGDELASQIGGLISGFLPSAAGSVIGMAQHAREQQLQREGEAAGRRLDRIDAEQDGQLDRLELLHAEHQRRCAAAPRR